MERDAQTFNATIKDSKRNITDLLNIEFEGNSTNENKSNIHTTVNDWYAAEMTNYTQYIVMIDLYIILRMKTFQL